MCVDEKDSGEHTHAYTHTIPWSKSKLQRPQFLSTFFHCTAVTMVTWFAHSDKPLVTPGLYFICLHRGEPSRYTTGNHIRHLKRPLCVQGVFLCLFAIILYIYINIWQCMRYDNELDMSD